MTTERQIDLYLEWEQALLKSEVDVGLVASLESAAEKEGINLFEIGRVLLAASWNADLHPRGRDGRFIELFGIIKAFDFTDGKGRRHSEARGQVLEIRPDENDKGNPNILMKLDNGDQAWVKPNQVGVAPQEKARLDAPSVSVEELHREGFVPTPQQMLDLNLADKPGEPTTGRKARKFSLEEQELRDRYYKVHRDDALARGDRALDKDRIQEAIVRYGRIEDEQAYEDAYREVSNSPGERIKRVGTALNPYRKIYDYDAFAAIDRGRERRRVAKAQELARQKLGRPAKVPWRLGMVAADFNPDLHPRGRDGRFIEVFGLIQIFGSHAYPDGTRAKVSGIRPGKVKGNPDIDVEIPRSDGSIRTITVKPNQIESGLDVKARLDAPDARSLQEYEGRSDPDAEVARARFQLGLKLDMPSRTEEGEALKAEIRERLGREDGGLSDEQVMNYREELLRVEYGSRSGSPAEEDMLQSFRESGLPKSTQAQYDSYAEKERAAGNRPLDVEDWLTGGEPEGAEAPEAESDSDTGFLPGGKLTEEQARTTPLWMAEDALADEDGDGEAGERERERIRIDIENIKRLQGEGESPEVVEPAEARPYNETREVGNLMVGDEVILPGDIPGTVTEFEFPEGSPDSIIVHTDNGTYHGKTTDVLPSLREGETVDTGGGETNPIGEPITVEPGELGSKTNPIKTADPLEAVQALHDGKYVELESIDQVSTLLDELADIANEAKEAGVKAPNYDLCLVTVPDTNLFCAESKGIPRIQMPQLSGIPLEGSRAADLPANDGGEVNIGPQFVEHLRAKGVSVEERRILASHLKASQSELVGAKVAGMMKWMESGDERANNVIRESAIFVTRDGYVVDGHHRWAAVVGLDAAEGGLDDLDMPVREIDMDILDVLQEANDFALDFGLPGQAAVASGKP